MADARYYWRVPGARWEETDLEGYCERARAAGTLPHTRFSTQLVEGIVTTSGHAPQHDDSPAKDPDRFFHDKRIGQPDS